ncbi:hypothetical protein FRC12_008315 [Ceratobasidium sp. 428]|nr:hypothetical protein FRC12_008315 [Ceratobasidium sp. 428]
MSSPTLCDRRHPALALMTFIVTATFGVAFVTGLVLGTVWCLRAVASSPTVFMALCVLLLLIVHGLCAICGEPTSARTPQVDPSPVPSEQKPMAFSSPMAGSDVDRERERQPRRQPGYATSPSPVLESWMSGPNLRSSYTTGFTSTPSYGSSGYDSKAPWTTRLTASSYTTSASTSPSPSTSRYSSSGCGSKTFWTSHSTASSYSRPSRFGVPLAYNSQPSLFRSRVESAPRAQPVRRRFEPPQYVNDLFAPSPAPSTADFGSSKPWTTPAISSSSSLPVDQAAAPICSPAPTLEPAVKTAGCVRPGSPSLVSPRDFKRQRIESFKPGVRSTLRTYMHGPRAAAAEIAGVHMDIDVPVAYAPEVDMLGPTAGDMDVDEVEMEWEREQVDKDVEMKLVFDEDVEMLIPFLDEDEEMECAEMMMDWDALVAY